MAKTLMNSTLTVAVFSIFVTQLLTVAIEGTEQELGRRLSPTKLGLRKEKLTHIRVYWHDVVSGPKPTSVQIVKPANSTSNNGFGTVVMMDDALTTGPELSSKLVGRAQGLFALAAQNEVGVLMAMNFVFIEGKYNGSTISIMGRNRVLTKVREMPIIGGSGLFRFARGYVEARTHMFNTKTFDATVEYNVYVMHY